MSRWVPAWCRPCATATGGSGVAVTLPRTGRRGAHHYPWLPVRLLLKDRFRVTEHLSNSQVPLTVIYGDRDSVVPTERARGWLTRRQPLSNGWRSAGPTTTTRPCSARRGGRGRAARQSSRVTVLESLVGRYGVAVWSSRVRSLSITAARARPSSSLRASNISRLTARTWPGAASSIAARP